MHQYLELLRDVYYKGEPRLERNGATVGFFGRTLEFDRVWEKFPIVTSKQVHYKGIVAELLGFIRGADSAEEFRSLGTKIWDENANDNAQWLANPQRLGTDHLGRIYGKQWREWRWAWADPETGSAEVRVKDQLAEVVEMLSTKQDKRRCVLLGWHPGENENMMALPPCHMFAQFSVRGGERQYLDMTMYQRSCDLPLGVPYNISSYATLMHILGRICDLKPRRFTHILGDVHIYKNQMVVVPEQLKRNTHSLPQLVINPALKTLQDFEERATADDFNLIGYEHSGRLDYPFSV